MDNCVTLASLGPLPIWVGWRNETRDGRATKVPYNPRTGSRAASNDRTTWSNRAGAIAWNARNKGDGTGIQLGPLGDGRSIGGIDLDTCRDPVTGVIEPWALEVIERFGSYCEVSPSGTGVKIFFLYLDAISFQLDELFGGEAKTGLAFKRGTGEHPAAIEIYRRGRYFAVTDLRVGDCDELRLVELVDLEWLIEAAGPAFKGNGATCGNGEARKPRDESGSGRAFREGLKLARNGASQDEMHAELLNHEDPEIRRSAKKEGARGSERIYEKAALSEDGRRVIRVSSATPGRSAEDIAHAIVATGAPVFQRSGQVLEPVSELVPTYGGGKTKISALRPLTSVGILKIMERAVACERFEKRDKKWVPTAPPSLSAQMVLAQPHEFPFSRCSGIISTPSLRWDGSILSEPGYDAATQLYHAQNADINLPDISEAPSMEDAVEALAVLEDLLEEFPFEDNRIDKAVALSVLMTPVLRVAMDAAPLQVVAAPAFGSGKGFLIVLDEMASMSPSTWSQVIRPTLSATGGWVAMIGTPRGHNVFYDAWTQAQANPITWFSACLRADETGILSDIELADARRHQTEEEFAQEYLCSFEAAIRGAYFGKEMAAAEQDGRITDVAPAEGIPIQTAWDLGFGDSTAIWAFQVHAGEIRVIGHYENHGEPLSHYAAILRGKGWADGTCWVPHDASVHELGTGRSRIEVMVTDLGLKPALVPRHRFEDGIEAARLTLKRCWFDRKACSEFSGLEALRQYSCAYDEKRGVFSDQPHHDWASHSADAFRYLAMAWRELVPPRIEEHPPPFKSLSEMTFDEYTDDDIVTDTGVKWTKVRPRPKPEPRI